MNEKFVFFKSFVTERTCNTLTIPKILVKSYKSSTPIKDIDLEIQNRRLLTTSNTPPTFNSQLNNDGTIIDSQGNIDTSQCQGIIGQNNM